MLDTASKREKVILVGVPLNSVTEDDHQQSLDELERLVQTLGYDVVARLSQRRANLHGGVVLGDGKLKELAGMTGGEGVVKTGAPQKLHKAAERFLEQNKPDIELPPPPSDVSLGASLVVFDCELSPSQLANLQSALGLEVLDRTGVIVEIFSRHAKTRAAKIQVEIAQLSYLSPRLRETGGQSERQGGGIGGRGSGESAIELDRRRIRDKIAALNLELKDVQFEQESRRSRRVDQNSVALVGYTNAGKSSLMRALTGSQVLVEDKLFATLDTTVRTLQPETTPKILISDTVGFIKKLPHDLVASFKSTLDEALAASLLMYVVDSSDPHFRSQLEVTRTVLGEIGAEQVPSLLILNKSDKLASEEKERLMNEYPDAFMLSTRNADDVALLHKKICDFFESKFVQAKLFVPYSVTGAIGEIRKSLGVVGENYDEEGVSLDVKGTEEDIARIVKAFGL